MTYFIGMMSGTSLDGIDAVLAYQSPQTQQWSVCRHTEVAIPPALKQTLYRLNFPATADSQGNNSSELHTAQLAANAIAQCYAKAYHQLMQKSAIAADEIAADEIAADEIAADDIAADDIAADDIIAIGAHGQTVRHEPNITSPYSIQLLNGALLSQLTGQTVVCDFRSKDIAAGGQGAPLAPLFHQILFHVKPPFAVVNIGGIANISVIPATGGQNSVSGFDCGPGNCLLDEWCEKHQHQPFDQNGKWAQQGAVIDSLLQRLLTDDYFALPPPKSSGRDYFNLDWLAYYLQGDEQAVDVMRTLLQLTATAIDKALPREIKHCILVGGGAKNKLLCKVLNEKLIKRTNNVTLSCGNDYGFDVQHVEALGFAILAEHAVNRRHLATQAITGAKQASILGAVYYA